MRTRSKSAQPTQPVMNELPAWHGLQGTKRIQAEFKVGGFIADDSFDLHHGLRFQYATMCVQYLTNKISAGEWPQVKNLSYLGDNITKWRFELKDFDNSLEGGRDLNTDLSVCCISIVISGTIILDTPR